MHSTIDNRQGLSSATRDEKLHRTIVENNCSFEKFLNYNIFFGHARIARYKNGCKTWKQRVVEKLHFRVQCTMVRGASRYIDGVKNCELLSVSVRTWNIPNVMNF